MQIPASFEYERATSVDNALELLQARGPEARLLAGGHSLLPMMKLRLAAPECLIDIDPLAGELGYIREQGGRGAHRCDDAPSRAARVRAAGLTARDLHRRRARDRRPRGAQPRHDRRCAVPGRPRGGPLGGLRRGRRELGHPRPGWRARRDHAGVPPRPVRDRSRRRRDARRDPRAAAATDAGSAYEKVERRRRGLGGRGRPASRCASTAARSPRRASR